MTDVMIIEQKMKKQGYMQCATAGVYFGWILYMLHVIDTQAPDLLPFMIMSIYVSTGCSFVFGLYFQVTRIFKKMLRLEYEKN